MDTRQSPEDDRLVIGGSLVTGRFAGYSGIAQVSLVDNSIDFARHYSLANTISSVAYAPTSSNSPDNSVSEMPYIAALATQDLADDNSKAYLLMIGADGEMVREPIGIPL